MLGAGAIKAQAAASILGRNDLAPVIMAAGRANMVRPFQLAAFGAFGIGLRAKGMVRPAHIALRRRGFSFWNRHGGHSLCTISCGSAAKRCRSKRKNRPGR